MVGNHVKTTSAFGIVAVLCLASTTLAAASDTISVEPWTLEVAVYSASQEIPVYVSPSDAEDLRAVTSVPKSPYIDGLSSVVLLQKGDGKISAVTGGRLSAKRSRILVVEVSARNGGRQAESLRLGDVALKGPSGKDLTHVAVAAGDSHLVAKLTPESQDASRESAVSVEPGATTLLTYAFAIGSKTDPVRVSFRGKDLSPVEHSAMPRWERPKGTSRQLLQMRGTIGPLGEEMTAPALTASLQSTGDVRFDSDVKTMSTRPYAAYVDTSAAVTSWRVAVEERRKGSVSTREVPGIQSFGDVVLLAGTISFQNPVETREVASRGSVPDLQVSVRMPFEADKGDVLAAYSSPGAEDRFVLSIVTLE